IQAQREAKPTPRSFPVTGVQMIGSSIWDQVLSRIETKVNRHIFYTWFKPTTFVGDDGSRLRIRVPNDLFRDWLTKHYATVLDEALGEVDRKGTTVTFVTDAPEATDAPVIATPPSAPAREMLSEAVVTDAEEDPPSGNLAPRYSFDTFIVGPS